MFSPYTAWPGLKLYSAKFDYFLFSWIVTGFLLACVYFSARSAQTKPRHGIRISICGTDTAWRHEAKLEINWGRIGRTRPRIAQATARLLGLKAQTMQR